MKAIIALMTSLAVAAGILVMVWPSTAQSQADVAVSLQAGWNNVVYTGDPLPPAEALNDALPIAETLWHWRATDSRWESWTKGALDLVNSLPLVTRGDVFWLRTAAAGTWTQRGSTPSLGAPGTAGLHCWDLNGDGVFDPAEDRNPDGVADALDCQGAAGPPGADGLDGSGTGGLQNYEIVSTPFEMLTRNPDSFEVRCPIPKRVVGGGHNWRGLEEGATASVSSDRPLADGSGWRVVVREEGVIDIRVYAICVGPKLNLVLPF